ncbi:MAG TPA: CopG family transcriptional regulator [Acidimicrobiia bacterium]|nr:CopG family transcriptional regulator [Acidimicrobiia bacterium]
MSRPFLGRILTRVDKAAQRLGISRSEFFARAADRRANELDQDDLTEQINLVLASVGEDENGDFLDQAARRTLVGDNP